MCEVFETYSAEETFELGRRISLSADAGEVYCLNGDLGTGKTVFTKGFAAGLSIDDTVSSPTFTIVQEYHGGRLPFYHFDVYRISDPEEMYEIGLDEYLFGNGVCLVEWADIIKELLPKKSIRISIEKNLEKGFDYRRITVEKI